MSWVPLRGVPGRHALQSGACEFAGGGIKPLTCAARNAEDGVPYRTCANSPWMESNLCRMLRGCRGRHPLRVRVCEFAQAWSVSRQVLFTANGSL